MPWDLTRTGNVLPEERPDFGDLALQLASAAHDVARRCRLWAIAALVEPPEMDRELGPSGAVPDAVDQAGTWPATACAADWKPVSFVLAFRVRQREVLARALLNTYDARAARAGDEVGDSGASTLDPCAGRRATMRRFLLPIFVVLSLMPASGEAVTLVDTFGPGDSFNPSASRGVTSGDIFGNTKQAQPFITPTGGPPLRLEAIEMALSLFSLVQVGDICCFSGKNEIDISIVRNDVTRITEHNPFGAPDENAVVEHFHLLNLLASAPFAGPAGAEAILRIPSVDRPVLPPHHQFWLVASTPDVEPFETYIAWWGGVGTTTPSVVAERFNDGAWEVAATPGPAPAFRITAIAVPSVTPGAMFLIAGMITVAWTFRRLDAVHRGSSARGSER